MLPIFFWSVVDYPIDEMALRAVVAAWIVFGGTFVVALGRAVASKPIETKPPATESQMRGAYSLMASEEQKMRRAAVKDFPADPWSQDDAFHNQETVRARQIAEPRSMSLQDVLFAMDEGMRQHWPKPVAYPQRATVPPCRPRPIH